jgi:predicted nucleic acid-binding Zn ribbon protein
MIDLPRKDVLEKKEKALTDVIKRLYDKYRITQKMDEIELVKLWGEIVGPLIAKHTIKIEMRGKTLYVSFDQAPLKNEMFMQREQLRLNINERLGPNFVEKIFIG